MESKATSQTSTPALCHDTGFNCIAASARVLDRALTRLYEDPIRPLGLRAPQMTLLVVISRKPGITATQVAQYLVIDRSTLSRNLTRMAQNGWVREEESAADARARPLYLTPAGQRLLTKAMPKWKQSQIKAKEMLGVEAAERMVTLARELMTMPGASESDSG